MLGSFELNTFPMDLSLPVEPRVLKSGKKRGAASKNNNLQWGGEVQINLQPSGRVFVGNGRDTKFWVSTWISGKPLCAKFPSLSVFASYHEVLVKVLVTGRNFKISHGYRVFPCPSVNRHTEQKIPVF